MERAFDRRTLLRAGAGMVAGAALGTAYPWARARAQSPSTSPLGSLAPVPPGVLWLLTSPDHWDPGVLQSLAADSAIDVRISPLVDDAHAFAEARAGAPQLDVVTGDGGWIRTWFEAGLTQPIDVADIPVAAQLYPVARTMDLLQGPGGLLAYPWSWSPLQVVYDPTQVDGSPDSWDVLLDRRARGRIVIEAQQTDLVLCAGVATGARDPLDMSDAELAAATDWLRQLKPGIGRIVRQRSDAIAALASGACTMSISGLGAPDLVKDAGGPEVAAFVPKEGTIGSIEGEMLLATAPDAIRLPTYLDAAASAETCAAAFLADGRPLFNEDAYQLLVNAGHGDRAERYLYDRPEVALDMVLTGPGTRPDAYRAAAEVIFGEG